MNKSQKMILIVFATLIAFSCEKKSSVVFCSWGGSYQAAQREAYLDPFEERFGNSVDEATYSGEYAKIKGMVETGNVQWDIVSVTLSLYTRGAKEGLFEELNFVDIDTTNLLPGTVQKYGIAHLVFSTVMAYNTDYFENTPRPTSWKEFWNPNKFSGDRALRDTPKGNLEFALLADGVPSEELYPLDIDRAFKKLTDIKPFIRVWWKEGQQPPQMLATEEVYISTAFNGRIWKAKNDGEPVEIEWNGGMLEPEFFVVLRGSKNKDVAMKLINFALQQSQQENFVKIIAYGPTNRLVFDNLSKELVSDLPSSPDNRKRQFLMNGEWWAKNEDKVLERWNSWKISSD